MNDIWSLPDNPTFMFIFHEIVCLLGALYYLAPTLTRLREKKAGKPFTTSWKQLKNIVATYIIVAESLFIYEDIKNGTMLNVEVAVVSQILAVVVIGAAYAVLREEPEDENKKSLSSIANPRGRKK